MISQKLLLLVAVFLSSGSLLIGVPIIGLSLKGDELALATFAIMINSMLGIFDIVRPAVTRALTSEFDELSASWLFTTAAYAGFILSVFGYVGLSIASFPFIDQVDIVLFSLCIFIFCVASSFWGAMDARGFVGTAQLYRATATCLFVFTLVLQGHYIMAPSPSMALFVSLIILATLMVGHANSKCALKRTTTTSIKFSEFGYLLLQNLAKLPIDFADRFVAAKVLPVAQYASYGLIYEYVSKVSIAPQLLSAYYYPKLCSKEVSPELFLKFGFFICITLNAIGWMLFFTLDTTFAALFDTSLNLSWLVPAMFCFFASHSLNFFGQTLGRSFGLQRELAVSFGLAAAIGLISLVVMLFLIGASAYVLALSIAALKSSFLFFAPVLFGRVAPRAIVISILLSAVSLCSGIAIIILSGIT